MSEALGVIVRAVDVGYGHVKFVVGHDAPSDPIECESFESRATLERDRDIAGGVVERHDVFVVPVNGKRFTVGKDVRLAADANDASDVLSDDFALTDEHMARLYGALSYIREGLATSRIDWLILGLPLTTYESKRQALEAKVVGEHVVNSRGDTLAICNVRVFPQPLGSFFQHGLSRRTLAQMREEVSLVIDPGANTVDWLLCAGLKPIASRSGAERRGMSYVMLEIAKEIERQYKFGIPLRDIVMAIDQGLALARPVRLFNEVIDLAPFRAQAQIVIDQALNQLAASVGKGADIHNVLLTGGGAAFFFDAVQRQFPRHRVIRLEAPHYANVRGFQMIGEQWAHSAQRATTGRPETRHVG